jgi:CyaY protein
MNTSSNTSPDAWSATEFSAFTDQLLERIVDTLDDAAGVDDAALNQGVLDISCDNGSKIIINRHAPTQEIWIAARSGGYHFRRTATGWQDTRSAEALPDALSRIVAEQTGSRIRFDV